MNLNEPYSDTGPSADTLRALETAPNMYLILSPELYILTASDLYLKATETTREALVGRHIFEAFPDDPGLPGADGVQNINASLQEALSTKRPHYMSIQRYDVPDRVNPGRFIQRYWNPSHTPVLDHRGEISYIIQLATNVTRQVLAEKTLEKSKAEQQETLAQVQVLNQELAASGVEITVVNQELQHSQENLLELNELLEERISRRTTELAESENQLRAALVEQVSAREAVADTNARLNIALDAGALGYTEVDLATGKMQCNEQFKKCFGRNKDDGFTYSDLFEAMLPEYREHIRAQVTLAQQEHSVYRANYQISWPDGSVHWINAHGKARYDEQGNPDRMVGIIADITEIKQDEQRKNVFIGMVSHELKTPLTSLNGYLQMLQIRARKTGEAISPGPLDKAIQQVKKMTTMINGFLNVSRLESGKIDIDKQRFDMAGLLREVEEESIFTISSHQLAFEVVSPVFVIADRDKIGQVVNNFIGNAVKYSPAGSHVWVACTRVNDHVQVSVRDGGIGIKSADQPKLFDPYYRVEDPQTKMISGFGIGLYLSAEIIKRHQGDIWVESEAGRGSSFYFTLPLD